jgi:hypothetical protein
MTATQPLRSYQTRGLCERSAGGFEVSCERGEETRAGRLRSAGPSRLIELEGMDRDTALALIGEHTSVEIGPQNMEAAEAAWRATEDCRARCCRQPLRRRAARAAP